MPPLDFDVADLAPTEPALTPYDKRHAITYMRLLDADAEGADWREVAQIVLHIDPDREPDRARRAFDSHLARFIAIVAERAALPERIHKPRPSFRALTAAEAESILGVDLLAALSDARRHS